MIPRNCLSMIHIDIHRQICFVLSEHISVARRARFPKLGSKPGWLKRQSKILPLNHEEASEVNLNGYKSQLLLFTYFRLTATESSIHTKSLAYSLESSTLRGLGSIYICVCVKSKVGDQKAPFSVATTPKCWGGRYSFSGLLPFTLDTYLILLSVKQGGIKYHF